MKPLNPLLAILLLVLILSGFMVIIAKINLNVDKKTWEEFDEACQRRGYRKYVEDRVDGYCFDSVFKEREEQIKVRMGCRGSPFLESFSCEAIEK